MPAPRSSSMPKTLSAHLAAQVEVKQANNILGIDKYVRSADLLERQANLYRQKDNVEQLYVILMRYASLVVETITRHKDYNVNDPRTKKLRLNQYHLQNVTGNVMPELERLKTDLDLRDMMRNLDQSNPWNPTLLPGTTAVSTANLPEISWDLSAPSPTSSGSISAAETGLYQPVRASSAQKDSFSLPDVYGTGAIGLPDVYGTGAMGMPSLPEMSMGLQLPTASQATLSRHAILPTPSAPSTSGPAYVSQPREKYPTFDLLGDDTSQQPPPWRVPPRPAASSSAPAMLDEQMAGLYMDSNQAYQNGTTGYQNGAGAPSSAAFPPIHMQLGPRVELALGPQELDVGTCPMPTAPLPPGTTCSHEPNGGAITPASQGVAEVKRRKSMRDVHVSVALMDEFMRYATSNTRRNIETCGILAGTLSADDSVFTISTLIVPKQEGSTDMVQAMNEEEIFEVQDSRSLYPLGWIHTHPSQTCFMSSVDVHTHCGYQTMLDEAVAIVMAPRDTSKRVGIFRLSTPGGLKLVQKCPHRGFHAHDPTSTGQPLYELCGHVYLNPRVKHDVVDLR